MQTYHLITKIYAAYSCQSYTGICTGNLPTTNTSSSELQLILNIFFGILGALSLLMITISGFRYIISDGDPQKAKQAREGITYALVGIAVALLAGAIINFVIGSL
jgi:hypothetical protein